MNEQEAMRRDIARLASDLSKGTAAMTVIVEQTNKQVSELNRRLDDKVKDDHKAAIELAQSVAEIRTKLGELAKQMDDLPERVAKLETNQEHVAKDITGKHDLAKTALEAGSKKEDRELEKKRLAAEQKRAQLQFWGGIAVVALPGLISLILHLFGVTTPPAEHPETPSSHSTP